MRLLLFNPDTEYALATGASFYTAPASVEALRAGNQLLPERWALPGDVILVDDVGMQRSSFQLVEWSMLRDFFVDYPETIIDPWGWNPSLVRKFLDYGVPASSLPDDAAIQTIRRLAHRRTAVTLIREWNKAVGEELAADAAQELFDESDCLRFLDDNPGCWFKAPWSSSGRGVINTRADMSREQVRQWCHGIIRRQGSVLAETGADRLADFATEWEMKKGRASYLGLSCFNTSNRGKYIDNLLLPQSELIQKFDSISAIDISTLVAIQKNIIEMVLGDYSGFMGIDIIVETNRKIRPFVEVNLRRTMGIISLR